MELGNVCPSWFSSLDSVLFSFYSRISRVFLGFICWLYNLGTGGPTLHGEVSNHLCWENPITTQNVGCICWKILWPLHIFTYFSIKDQLSEMELLQIRRLHRRKGLLQMISSWNWMTSQWHHEFFSGFTCQYVFSTWFNCGEIQEFNWCLRSKVTWDLGSLVELVVVDVHAPVSHYKQLRTLMINSSHFGTW